MLNSRRIYYPITLLLVHLLLNILVAQHQDYIVVDQEGNGDFTTLTAAINSLPMYNYERTTIFIKNGVYEEKILIEQDNVTLEGEERGRTIIQYNQLRSDWEESKDAIGPAVINLDGDDIIIKNLTIKNTQAEIGPHAFAIYGTGTRTILLNCDVLSKGGDTVSLWDCKTGMYYHADCSFTGAVDFVCPRGWCFIKNSQFYELKETAATWHAGGFERDQKLVIVDSKFDGVPGFKLGRHHYDAQFYLLNCQFSQQLSDNPIYRVTYPDEPERDRPFSWGKRYYFYNCHRQGGDFEWFCDNLETAPGNPKPGEITTGWTFDGRWNPESGKGPYVVKYKINGKNIRLNFSENVSVIGKPQLISRSGCQFQYLSGGGSDNINLQTQKLIKPNDLIGLKIINDGKILGTVAAVDDRIADLNIEN